MIKYQIVRSFLWFIVVQNARLDFVFEFLKIVYLIWESGNLTDTKLPYVLQGATCLRG